jgi:hypothetical protein
MLALQVPDQNEHKPTTSKAASVLKRIASKLSLGSTKVSERQQAELVDTNAMATGALHTSDAAMSIAGTHKSIAGTHKSHTSEQAAVLQLSASLPFQSITLVFRDIRYWVPNPVALLAKGKRGEGALLLAATL